MNGTRSKPGKKTEYMEANVTHAERLAEFVARASYEDLSDAAVRELKIRVLDSLGCAIGALRGEPVRLVREQIEEFGGNPLATLVGGGKTAPDRAALYNGALIRYLDYNDSYLAKGALEAFVGEV